MQRGSTLRDGIIVAGLIRLSPGIGPMSTGIENILCSVDLTVLASDAVSNAFALGERFGATVYVCCRSGARAFDQAAVKRFISKGLAVGKAKYKARFIDSGDPVEWTLDQARDLKADLLVVGKAASSARRIPSDPEAREIARRAHCPVLATQSPSAGRPEFSRVLVAHDFSDYSESALQNALRLALAFGSELHLLHVLPRPRTYRSDVRIDKRVTGKIYHETIARLETSALPPPGGKGFTNIKYAVRWGRPYSEILNYARENRIDMIAMGVFGADFGKFSIFGSNTERVSRQSECAVLVDRPLYTAARRELDLEAESLKFHVRSNLH